MKPLMALTLMLMASPVMAKSVDVYLGGRYTCEFDGSPTFINAEGPFELEVTQSGIHSRTRHLKLTNQDSILKAKEFRKSSFREVTSDFPTKKNLDIAYVYFTGDSPLSTQVELSLAFKTQSDVYSFDRMKCRGESTMKKVPVVQVDCAIEEANKEATSTTRVRFGLANMVDAYDFLLLSYAGDSDAEAPVQVTPKSSYFSNINKNLKASLTRDYMLFESGSFTRYRSFIRIDRPAMTQGIAWLESGKEEVPESRRPVRCKVKGPVEPHPQERMH